MMACGVRSTFMIVMRLFTSLMYVIMISKFTLSRRNSFSNYASSPLSTPTCSDMREMMYS